MFSMLLSILILGRFSYSNSSELQDEKPLIIHHHIPKVAGTSFQILMMKENIQIVSRQRCLENLIAEYGSNRTIFTVTFLREPYTHVKSQFLFCRDSEWGLEVTKNSEFPRSSDEEEDFRQWLNHFVDLKPDQIGWEYDYDCQDPRDTMTRHLACYGEQKDTFNHSHPTNHAIDESQMKSARAISNLHGISFIGLQSRMEESMCLLGKLYNHEFEPITHYNHGVEHSDERLPREKFRELVRKITWKDRGIYGYGLKLFQKQLERFPECQKNFTSKNLLREKEISFHRENSDF